MDENKVLEKKEISAENFVFLAGIILFFVFFSLKMGMVNTLNTFMNTAYSLLMDTVFYLMAICVMMGAISALCLEFGVVALANKILDPLMKPLYGLPGVAVCRLDGRRSAVIFRLCGSCGRNIDGCAFEVPCADIEPVSGIKTGAADPDVCRGSRQRLRLLWADLHFFRGCFLLRCGGILFRSLSVRPGLLRVFLRCFPVIGSSGLDRNAGTLGHVSAQGDCGGILTVEGNLHVDLLPDDLNGRRHADEREAVGLFREDRKSGLALRYGSKVHGLSCGRAAKHGLQAEEFTLLLLFG